MASSASHTNPFSRPPGRIPSDSSSGDSSWSHHHRHWPPYPPDMVQPFTPEMRDRQARGKDPYLPEADDPPHLADRPARGRGGPMAAMSTIGMPGPAPSRQPKEPFQKTERRDWAETVLDNPELLMMYAQSNGDTLPVTRLKFKKIMCGLDDYDDDDASLPDFSQVGLGGYQNQNQQHPRFSSPANSAQRGEGGGAASRGGRR